MLLVPEVRIWHDISVTCAILNESYFKNTLLLSIFGLEGFQTNLVMASKVTSSPA